MSANFTTADPGSANSIPETEPCITLHHSEKCNPSLSDPLPTSPSPHLPISDPPPKPGTREFPLTGRQRRAIALLVLGRNDLEVAKAVGVNRSTLYRWRIYHTTFQTELNRQRNSIWLNNFDRMRALMTKALDTLETHLQSSNERAAFRSAVSILRFAKASPPSGPLDEYDLLEEHYRRHAERELVAEKLSVFWPPDKQALDDLRKLFLKRAHNQLIAPPPPDELPPGHVGYPGRGVVATAELRP